MKVVRLSALYTGRLYPPGSIPATNFCQRMGRPDSHSTTGRIMSMKNSSDTTRNRIRDLQTCSTVSQPIAPSRSPFIHQVCQVFAETSGNILYFSESTKLLALVRTVNFPLPSYDYLMTLYHTPVGRDSSVGIATR